MAAGKNVSCPTAQWAGTFCSQPHTRDEAAQRLRCPSLTAISALTFGRAGAFEEEDELLRSSLHLEGDLASRSAGDLSSGNPRLALWRAHLGAPAKSHKSVERQYQHARHHLRERCGAARGTLWNRLRGVLPGPTTRGIFQSRLESLVRF